MFTIFYCLSLLTYSDQDEINEKIYKLNRVVMKEMKKCTGLLTLRQQAIQVKKKERIRLTLNAEFLFFYRFLVL